MKWRNENNMNTASLLTTTLNTRDLGNHFVSDGRKTVCDRIYRSDRQEHPSQEDVALLLSKGITTIIDMRTESEVSARPSGFVPLDAFSYINISVEEGSGIPESAEAVPGSYLAIACGKNMRRIFEAIAGSTAGVMYNCSAGKDRTGVVTAILLMLCGVSEKDIIADYMLTKECSRERFDFIRKNYPEVDMNIVIPREAFMRDFIKMFKNRFGDVNGYFKQIGVSEETKYQILKKMLEDDFAG